MKRRRGGGTAGSPPGPRADEGTPESPLSLRVKLTFHPSSPEPACGPAEKPLALTLREPGAWGPAMSKFRFFLLQLRAKLWVKPALAGLAAVGWVSLAWFAGHAIPRGGPVEISRELLFSLLQILASSMLTVAIFAVSAMVAAFASVAGTATPRATRVVMQDRSSQNTLAAFLSAFIYAIVALVALSAVAYGAGGRFMLFAGYAAVVAWVLVAFIRWVDEVSKLGRMHDTIRRVEKAAREALCDARVAGLMGGRPAAGPVPEGLRVRAAEIGYVQHIDVEALQAAAEEQGGTLRLLVRPGAFTDRTRPLAVLAGAREPEQEGLRERLAAAFTIGAERHLESDPRCGLLTLAEIADRALSPAVNDPGTAIAVMGSQIRLLACWTDAMREEHDVLFGAVEVPPLEAGDLLEDGFTPIARDGAGMYEVGMRLQKAFRSIADLGHPGLAAAAALHSRMALEQALEKLPAAAQREHMRELAEELFPPPLKGAS